MTKIARAQRSNIMRFLTSNGWKKEVSKDRSLTRYVKTGSGLDAPVYIYFNIATKDGDKIAKDVADALATISQFYGTSLWDIRHRTETAASATKLERHPHDLVTAKVPNENVFNDTISMNLAMSTLENLRRAVDESAYVEAEIRRSTLGRTVAAREFIDSCRFGHTFRGSFGFIIECPLREEFQLMFEFVDQPIPFGRAVVGRISKVLHTVCEAARTGDTDRIATDDGSSARLLNVFADFFQANEVERLSLSVEFDKTVRSPETADLSGDYLLKREMVPMLRKVAEVIEPVELEPDANIVGRIVMLRSKANPTAQEDPSKREVTILWDTESGKREVSALLSPEAYTEAIRAHQSGFSVQAKGAVQRKGRRYSFESVDQFVVLD